jgi:hypothetical protein
MFHGWFRFGKDILMIMVGESQQTKKLILWSGVASGLTPG